MDEEEAPPLSPIKVTVFVLILALIGVGGWRLYAARSAVEDVKAASKDYRMLFPARSGETAAPKPLAAAAAPSSGMMLKIDDDMRAPKPQTAAAPEAASSAAPPAAPPVADVKVVAASVRAPKKYFNQPRLNAGAFSTLNGGSGIGFSGGTKSGGGSAPAAPAAPAMPAIPGMPDAPDKK